jgi:hypothetical protein
LPLILLGLSATAASWTVQDAGNGKRRPPSGRHTHRHD